MQVEIFLLGSEMHRICLRAERRCLEIVFDVEHGFVLGDEGLIQVAFLEFKTLFVHGEVIITDQIGDLIAVVLQTDRKSLRMPVSCEESVVHELVVRTYGEPTVLGVAIDVVWINCVATFGDGQIDSVFHDGAEGGGVRETRDVEPSFARPTVERFSDDGGRKLGGVGSPLLVTSRREIANHFSSLIFQGRDH